MTTTTQTIADFLLARANEAAREVDTIPDWWCTDSARGEGWGSRGDCDLCGKYMFDGSESATKDAFWEHMEEVHRRTFVLAECESKRAIIEAHENERQRKDAYNRGYDAGDLTTEQDLRSRLDANVRWRALDDTLRHLARAYRDHPDFDPAWR